VIIHQIGKTLTILQLDIILILIDPRQSVLTVIKDENGHNKITFGLGLIYCWMVVVEDFLVAELGRGLGAVGLGRDVD
jgi:hypothetical protein